MIHLSSITLDVPRDARDTERFPFGVPAIRQLGELCFEHPVSFFVGENGSGKSTLLEALAWAAESVVAGSESLDLDASLEAA